MQLLFILLAISLPLAGIAFLVYRGKLAKNNQVASTNKNSSKTPVRSKQNGFLIVVIFLLVGTIALMFFKDSIGFGRHKYTATKFSPTDIAELVQHDNNFIGGECKAKYACESYSNNKYTFKSVKKNIKKIIDYSEYRFIYERENSYTETMCIWSNFRGRACYQFSDKKKYLSFISELRYLDTAHQKKIFYGNIFNDEGVALGKDSIVLFNNCLFVKCGYLQDYQAYCIIAIQQDRIYDNFAFEVTCDLNTILKFMEAGLQYVDEIRANDKYGDIPENDSLLVSINNYQAKLLVSKFPIEFNSPIDTKIYGILNTSGKVASESYTNFKYKRTPILYGAKDGNLDILNQKKILGSFNELLDFGEIQPEVNSILLKVPQAPNVKK